MNRSFAVSAISGSGQTPHRTNQGTGRLRNSSRELQAPHHSAHRNERGLRALRNCSDRFGPASPPLVVGENFCVKYGSPAHRLRANPHVHDTLTRSLHSDSRLSERDTCSTCEIACAIRRSAEPAFRISQVNDACPSHEGFMRCSCCRAHADFGSNNARARHEIPTHCSAEPALHRGDWSRIECRGTDTADIG